MTQPTEIKNQRSIDKKSNSSGESKFSNASTIGWFKLPVQNNNNTRRSSGSSSVSSQWSAGSWPRDNIATIDEFGAETGKSCCLIS